MHLRSLKIYGVSSIHLYYEVLLISSHREHLESCNLHSVHEKLSIIHHPAMIPYVHKFFKEVHSSIVSMLYRMATVHVVVQLAGRANSPFRIMSQVLWIVACTYSS